MSHKYRVLERGYLRDVIRNAGEIVVVEEKYEKCPSWLKHMGKVKKIKAVEEDLDPDQFEADEDGTEGTEDLVEEELSPQQKAAITRKKNKEAADKKAKKAGSAPKAENIQKKTDNVKNVKMDDERKDLEVI